MIDQKINSSDADSLRNKAKEPLDKKLEDMRRMATVISDSNDAVIMHDLDGKILAWNRGAKETYGYTESEALGKNVREIVAESDREAAVNLIEKIRQGDIIKSFELRRVTKDGRILDVWLTTTLLTDEEGKPVAIATTERDITERKKAEEQYRETSNYLENLFNYANAPIIVWDNDYKITKFNRAFESLTGRTFKDVEGKGIDLLFPEKTKNISLCHIYQTAKGVRLEEVEIDIQNTYGTINTVLWNSANIYDSENKKIIATIAQGYDITKRKKAEIVLKEKMEELRRMATVVSDSNDAVIMHDLEGKILAWNHGAKENYGYTEAEALGTNVREIVAEPDREAALNLIRRIKQGDIVKSFELRRVAKDGRILDVWLTTTLLTDEKGKPVAIATTERDITDRNKAEHAIKDKLEDMSRMATVISDSNDAVILHDLDGKILAWNRGAKETYGYTETEALGMNVRDIVAEPDREAALNLIHRIKMGDIVKSFELRRVARDGRILDVWLTTTLLTDEKGKPVAIATTERDITGRKLAEAEIKKINAELEQRVYERTLQLETINKELETFAYSVSHDLRAPLRSIDGFSNLLLKNYSNLLDDQGKDYFRRVMNASKKMGLLIDDLLKLSRFTRVEMKREITDLSSFAKSIAEELQAADPERKATFVIQHGMIENADSDLIQIALQNLISNSWKYCRYKPETEIEFGTIEKEGKRVYFVRDNGAGFDMKYVDKLFGAFQRLHSVTEFEGTGIGLATVSRIIHRHGGRIWAEAVVDFGATFYFTL